jgi:hypothetical protein
MKPSHQALHGGPTLKRRGCSAAWLACGNATGGYCEPLGGDLVVVTNQEPVGTISETRDHLLQAPAVELSRHMRGRCKTPDSGHHILKFHTQDMHVFASPSSIV